MRTTKALLTKASLIVAAIFYSSLSSAACNCGSKDASAPCTGQEINVSVSSGGATVKVDWKFNSGGNPAQCGQFANGDYWVAPASGSSSVTVTQVTSSGSGAVSLDENPQLESVGLFGDGKTYGNYNADENLVAKLPLSFSQATSLVAGVRRNESSHGKCGTRAIEGGCAHVYNVVTILDKVPENAGATVFRPSIDEANKELLSWSDFDLARLPQIDYLQGTTASGYADIRQRWSHHTEALSVWTKNGAYFSEGGRAFRASLLVDDYAAGVAQAWNDNLMTIMSSDDPLEQKRAALAAMITYGKDLFFAIYNPSGSGWERTRNWGSGAGQSLGRFPAAVFFAAMAKDPKYANELKKVSTELLGFADYRGPHELEQINDGPNGPVWGDFPDTLSASELGSYWQAVLTSQCFDGATGTCNVNLGKKTQRDPYNYIDGPGNLPGTSYMMVSLGPQRGVVATMFLFPEFCETVNSPSLVAYIDRLENVGVQTKNDPCAPPDPREDSGSCDAYRASGCKYYGLSNTGTATWGPDPNNPDQCITNGSGQNGRFPARHGYDIEYVYSSAQVEHNWKAIRGTEGSCAISRPAAPKDLRVEPLGN